MSLVTRSLVSIADQTERAYNSVLSGLSSLFPPLPSPALPGFSHPLQIFKAGTSQLWAARLSLEHRHPLQGRPQLRNRDFPSLTLPLFHYAPPEDWRELFLKLKRGEKEGKKTQPPTNQIKIIPTRFSIKKTWTFFTFLRAEDYGCRPRAPQDTQ